MAMSSATLRKNNSNVNKYDIHLHWNGNGNLKLDNYVTTIKLVHRCLNTATASKINEMQITGHTDF